LSVAIAFNVGVPWIFAFGLVDSESFPNVAQGLAYIFVVINSLQGIAVFLVHVYQREDFETICRRYLPCSCTIKKYTEASGHLANFSEGTYTNEKSTQILYESTTSQTL